MRAAFVSKRVDVVMVDGYGVLSVCECGRFCLVFLFCNFELFVLFLFSIFRIRHCERLSVYQYISCLCFVSLCEVSH